MVLVVGLTGGIGSGKSLVGEYFADLGAKVMDADEISRRVVERGSEGWKNSGVSRRRGVAGCPRWNGEGETQTRTRGKAFPRKTIPGQRGAGVESMMLGLATALH